MKTLILYATFLASALAGGIMMGLRPAAFIQPIAALMVFFPCIAFLFYNYGATGTTAFLKRIWEANLTADDERFADKLCSIAFLFAGVTGLIGLIHVMGNLSDSSQLGTGIAVAFIGFLYGLVPAALVLPIKAQNKEVQKPIVHLKKVAGFVSLGIVFLIGNFFIILYALSKIH